ncbi:MAG: class I SAM-dependent methyltransferase [Candidatus Dormibacteria bacterium]
MTTKARGPLRRRAADAAPRIPTGLLRCPRCGRSLRPRRESLVCSRGHTHVALEGIYDLWPGNLPAPTLDWFATPYGLLYDTAIKERWLARLAGRVGWGTDVDRMFRLMDAGVKVGPAEVVLDVPVGGAPALRSAAGRMLGTYIGVDLSMEMLRRAEVERTAEGLRNVLLLRGDITRLPLTSSSVDRALCFNGLHVLPDKAAALQELHRVLKPGGTLTGNAVVGEPGSLMRPWFNRSWLFFHPALATDLRRVALAAGFVRWEEEQEGSMLYFEAETGLPKRPASLQRRRGLRHNR